MKSKSDFAKKIKRMKRRILFLKIRAFLLIILPIGIVTVGQAVIKEYSRIKIRKLAGSVKPAPQPAQSESQSEPTPDS